jgi:hypothetical protein
LFKQATADITKKKKPAVGGFLPRSRPVRPTSATVTNV